MSDPRRSRRPIAGWHEAVIKAGVDDGLAELARRMFHPTPAELQQVRMHLESACKMSLDDRAPYLLAAVARTYGLMDPEAQR